MPTRAAALTFRLEENEALTSPILARSRRAVAVTAIEPPTQGIDHARPKSPPSPSRELRAVPTAESRCAREIRSPSPPPERLSLAAGSGKLAPTAPTVPVSV